MDLPHLASRKLREAYGHERDMRHQVREWLLREKPELFSGTSCGDGPHSCDQGTASCTAISGSTSKTTQDHPAVAIDAAPVLAMAASDEAHASVASGSIFDGSDTSVGTVDSTAADTHNATISRRMQLLDRKSTKWRQKRSRLEKMFVVKGTKSLRGTRHRTKEVTAALRAMVRPGGLDRGIGM